MKRTIVKRNIEYEYGVLAGATDLESLTRVLTRCYGIGATVWGAFFARVGTENLRVIRIGSEVAGGLAIYFMGQWFGGRSVPMAGIAAVGVAPELRGTGVARELMARAMREFHESGIPISTLYPSTQRLYRKAGFEQAGTRCQFTLPTRSIQRGEDRDLPMFPVDPARHETFHAIYRERAVSATGNLDRNRAIWERAVTSRDPQLPVHAYIVGEIERPQGYAVFTQPEKEPGYELLVRDLVVLTPDAGRRLLAFFADHRSMARRMIWCGPLTDPLTCMLSEQDYRVKHLERWMLRVVDVPKALAMRGYPEGLDTELHLDVRDDVIAENQGRWMLRVVGGRAEVAQGGRGDLKLDVRGLAPLYTGFLSPQALSAIGFLEGQGESLTAAARLFAGPEPWMPDYF